MLSSALCMDKDMTKTVLTARGIPNARWLAACREDRDDAALAGKIGTELGWPVFVKPARAGSSVGVSRAEGPEGLAAALDTTPDEFLVGAARNENEEWRSVAELLRKMDGKQLDLARSFLTWLTGQTL